ncbi:aldehyde dehydrogenase family protein [Thalassotalea mangrovi]|uniref:Aldehyde dehydrogenase n=1 Tax=Thalassotalea mangrovi TaxID=2572245 RepID=A0A4U1B6E4_9GAMM|nr:aldehyde dehydrogenase family protein [Thalassotalea mangrovi]TKB46075.1 aldehyde dehydrogenase [Thalassotalea mangrovi]
MMTLPKALNYIDQQWQTPADTGRDTLHDANTGELLGYQAMSSSEQVNAAIACAKSAFNAGYWSELSYHHRAGYLLKIADALSLKAESIAELDAVQTGVVISFTRQFAQVCSLAFIAAANLLKELPEQQHLKGEHDNDIILERLPLGVAAIIAPWNAPSGIACHKIASALAAGCPVIFKPSEWAAGSAQLIAEAISEAELPEGVFQLVHGGAEVGAMLSNHPAVSAVSFTGGAQGGKAVGQSCGAQIKPAQLELGGNNALLVMADADLDKAAQGVVNGLVTMNAQWCRALGRLICDASIEQALLSKVADLLANIQLGNSCGTESHMGPLVHNGHLNYIKNRVAHYQNLGGQLLQVTPMPNLNGWFYPPTLITGLDSTQTLEETFGPVATVHTFDQESQAIAMANETDYGLAAYVFAEPSTAWRMAKKIRAGVVKINDVSLFALRPDLPRAAWGKSGLGDEGVKETFEFFRGTRVVGIA